MSLSLGRKETAAALHQNLPTGEVVCTEETTLDGRTKYWTSDQKQNYQAFATNRKKIHKTRGCTGIVYSTLLPTLRILFTLQ